MSEAAQRGITELKVSGHLMTLDAGMFCLFYAPGSVSPGESGLPGVRLSLPPRPSGPGVLAISTFREDGWLGGPDSAALIRVSRGPAQVLVTVYQELDGRHEAPRLQVMRLSAPSPDAAAGTTSSRAAAAVAPAGAGAAPGVMPSGTGPRGLATPGLATPGLAVPGIAGSGLAPDGAISPGAKGPDAAGPGAAGRGIAPAGTMAPATRGPGTTAPSAPTAGVAALPAAPPAARPDAPALPAPSAGLAVPPYQPVSSPGNTPTPPGAAPPASRPVVPPSTGALAVAPGADSAGIGPQEAEMAAHIQGRGDVLARLGGWMGEPGSQRWIEGFAVAPRAPVGREDIEYQAVLGRGWLSPWSEGGQYCGSRGMALPVLGLRVRLRGAAADRYACRVSATFVDGSRVGPSEAGEACEAGSMAPLEAFRIEIVARGVAPVPPGAAPASPRRTPRLALPAAPAPASGVASLPVRKPARAAASPGAAPAPAFPPAALGPAAQAPAALQPAAPPPAAPTTASRPAAPRRRKP